MNQNDRDTPWIIVCSLFLYRWLLSLTPDEFAAEYAESALHVFRESCTDAYSERGARGVLCLWLPTFIDALRGILAEQSPILRQVFAPRLVWPIVLVLGCVLFPFSWLSNTWAPFGYLFRTIFATPQIYFVGHISLFCAAGLILFLVMPTLRQHPHVYILCLMLGAFAEEFVQLLVHAHPGLHKDARNLLLDLCGIVLAYLLVRLWLDWRFSAKTINESSL